MEGRGPDFVVIGAMKCATSTLHEQLARRPGLFLSQPKEPNFFSDEENWSRGFGWYSGLFADATPDQKCGESSTHYTKLPTHPEAADRLKAALPELRLIYVMRDPIDRIVSQYVHEWSQGQATGSIDEEVLRNERYVAYSCYARQLRPYVERYGRESILLVSYERMVAERDATLREVCDFIGDPSPGPPAWSEDVGRQNVSSERMRPDAFRDRVLASPVGKVLRACLPSGLKQKARSYWTMSKRPELSAPVRAELEKTLDADLGELSRWVGLSLDCRSWREVAAAAPLRWSDD